MRPFFAFALGLTVATTAFAQFASDRPGTSLTTPFGGGTPAPAAIPTRPSPTPQPGAVYPTSATMPAPFPNPGERIKPVPTTIDPNQKAHPWAVTAEVGPWMICVKAYSGPNSKMMAEKFVKIIRDQGVAAYMFERNAIERRAELEKVESIRKQEAEKSAPFLMLNEQERKKAEASGHVFIETPVKIKVPTPYHETPEQWAVLIGGFPTDEAAKNGLKICQGKGPDPKQKLIPPDPKSGLLDSVMAGASMKDQSGKEDFQSAANFINPYMVAMIVPNPAVAQANRDEKGKLEPFVVKMNEEGTHSLLKAKKPWTLIVRSFTVPVKYVNRDEAKTNWLDMLKKTTGKSMYQVEAEEAVHLAEALSHPDMKPHPYKAFVLHHRSGSIVTVGEFDGPDSPDLKKAQQELIGITFAKLKDDKKTPVIGTDGRPEVQRMFDSVSPFPVPKY